MQLGSLIFNSKDKFTFQWTAAAGAASYRFSLIDDYGSVVKSGVVTGETHTETIHNQDFCTWQVEALDAVGNVIASERSPEIWFGGEGEEFREITALSPNLICMVMTQDFHNDSAPLNYYLASPDKYTQPIVSFRCSDKWPILALDDTLLLMDGELYVKNGSRYDFYGTLMQGENIFPRMAVDSSGFFSLNTTVYRYSGGRAVKLFTLPDSGNRNEIYFLNSQIAVTDSGVWRIAGTEPELAGTFDFPLPDASELTISGKYAVSYGYEGDSMISYRIDSRGNVSRLPDVPLSPPSGYQAYDEIDLLGNRVALLASDWEGGNRLSVYEISGDMWKLIHEQEISGFNMTSSWKDNSTIMLRDQAEDRLFFVRLPADSGAAPMEPDNIDGLAAQVKQYSVTVEWNKSSIRNCTYELLVDGLGSVVTKSNKFTFKNVPVGRYSGSVRVIAPDGTAGEWSEPYTIAVADVTAPKLGKVSAVVDGYTGVISWSGSDNVGVEYYEVRCADQVQVVSGTSARFENLAVGKYNAEVTAFDAAGNASKAGKVSIAVKDATPPEKVTGLAVPVVDSKYKATLSWAPGVDNSGKVANYEIQLDNGKILKSSKNSLSVSKLAVGEHSYRVRAVDKEKNVGEWSEVQTFTVKDMTAPTSVKGKATVDGYTVAFALSGKDNSGSIARYVVTCGNKSVETTTGTAVLSDFGVGRQTAYVVAYDAEGNASKETKVSFTVKDATPPEKVTGLAVPVVDSKYKATLSWDTGVDNSGKVANYEIQLDDGKILKSSKTTLNVSNLSVGEHSYKVRAIDKDKNVGEWSEVQTFTVRDMTAPNSVKAKATVNGYSVTFALSGKDNSGSVARYVVTCGDKSVETTTGTAVLSDFGVGKQTAYVVAYDAEGNASKETKVSFTVKDATPPEKVTGLAVPVVDSKYKATLSWDTGVDNSGKVANYEIQLDDGKILKSSKNSLSVSNLSIGEHTYRVRAIDKDRNVGEWSEVQTFTVRDMTAPGSVSVKAKVEGNSLLLSWKTPKDNVGVTGYILKHGANLEHTETLTANMLSFQIDGIAKGSYQYQIVAVDAAGNESKAKAGKATIKTELPMAALNLELPDFASLSGFDSDVQAVPELVDDPLAFCHTLELDAELKLSAAEMLGQDDANKRSGTLFAVAS